LLAEICDLFWMLLLCHHASAHLPSNPFIYWPFTIHICPPLFLSSALFGRCWHCHWWEFPPHLRCFALSNFCPPSLKSVCLLIVQYPSDTSALPCISSKSFNMNFTTKYAWWYNWNWVLFGYGELGPN
jgi:hypothetical protein